MAEVKSRVIIAIKLAKANRPASSLWNYLLMTWLHPFLTKMPGALTMILWFKLAILFFGYNFL